MQFYSIQKKNKNKYISLNPEIIPQQASVEKSKKIEVSKKIALKNGSDKVTTHHYEYVYGQTVGPIRYEKINFLEIGLGCDMGYGGGQVNTRLERVYAQCHHIHFGI